MKKYNGYSKEKYEWNTNENEIDEAYWHENESKRNEINNGEEN